ncbi:MAG TPA: hypothetical protein VGL23_13655 [Chloroflexota bacterium]
MRPGAVSSQIVRPPSAGSSPSVGATGASFESHLARAQGAPGFGQSAVGRWLQGAQAASAPTSRGSAWEQMIERRSRRHGGAAPAAGAQAGRASGATGAASGRAGGASSNARAHARRQADAAPAVGAWRHDDWAAPPPAPRDGSSASAGPSAIAGPSAPAMPGPRTPPMALGDYPRPPDDNGRGLHWIPTVASSDQAVDRFVGEAKKMHASWVVFLNRGSEVGANDRLVKKLVESGIEPVMRIYTPGVGPVPGDLEAMVRHYKALGVDYFQIGNEPNLRLENGGETPSVDRYLDAWVPAARRVIAAGGLPGFGALAPGGDVDDRQFLAQALDGLKSRGALDTLDRGWISLHNYAADAPPAVGKDVDGFLRFRSYDSIVREKLGRSIPIVGTEGGSYGPTQTSAVRDGMAYMDGQHEPYFFANTYWVIANAEGGGHDPQWEKHALFRADGPSPLVAALQSLA